MQIKALEEELGVKLLDSDIQFSAQMLWHREKWISPSMAAFIHAEKRTLNSPFIISI